MTEEALSTFVRDFGLLSHDHQLPPGGDWTTWLLLGGRGAGKTRAGAEWVRGIALGVWPFSDKPVSPIALVGETEHDAREVMVEGIAGLMAVHRNGERPQWISSRRRLEWPNGSMAQIFSAEDPDSLRGFQFAASWIDESVSNDLLQRSWRPIHALELSLVECPLFAMTLLHALWTGSQSAIAGFGSLSGLLMAYFGARFGILGVYVTSRSREKLAATTGEIAPGLIVELSKSLLKKK